MENNVEFFGSNSASTQSGVSVKSFMANVFSWMFAALSLTAVFAWYFASTGLTEQILRGSILSLIVSLSPLAFILVMSFGINRISYPVLIVLFLAFSAVMGISISYTLLVYTGASIASTFAVTAVTFGVMALMGYTTKQDLTGFGAIMRMALIGILIAMLVNFFLGSDLLDYIISCVGVLVFTGLSAYDVQKLKRIGEGVEYGSETGAKLAIMGALTLYLDFINLFLMLLRLFGRRD